jgi:Domain of unknown function (DUF4263)
MSLDAKQVEVAASSSGVADVLFLGVAERAAFIREGDTNVYKWNVLGLKNIVLSPIFPVSLGGMHFAIAVSPGALDRGGSLKFRMYNAAKAFAGSVDMSLLPIEGKPADPMLMPDLGLALPLIGTLLIFAPLDAPILIFEPGRYDIRRVLADSEPLVGQLEFVAVEVLPLSEERTAAIRSDPTASKAVRVELGCQHCTSKCRAYAGLGRSTEMESAGWQWYQDLPDVFVCECGAARVPLSYIRKSLHGVLGAQTTSGIDSADFRFTPLYEQGALESVRSQFAALLSENPEEERLQIFLKGNPILFHQFAATKIFAKPNVLTRFVADFAILTPSKELLLVEIERADTRLMKNDGGMAQPLNHAFDQVRDWLHVVDEHRLAVLDCLGIKSDDVGAIRGVVIAGRDAGYDALHLRRLKAEDRGRLSFYTYDDLLFALVALLQRIHRL